MRYVTLNNGVNMPQLGFGVWQVPDDEAYTAVARALDTGYRSVDTAAAYGNEDGVGRAVRDSGVPRDDLFIATKLWNSDQGWDKTMRACVDSLERLGLEYVDLYLMHWPMPERDLYIETWRAMERLHEEGLARAIGVCNFPAAHLDRLVKEARTIPVLNQIELHPYLTQAEMRAVDSGYGIATEAWSPLGQGKGLLSDPVLAHIAETYGRTPAQVVLRWHLQLGNIVIPKSVTPSRIEENLDVFGFSLERGDMDAISALNRNERFGPDPETMNALG
ncbi:MAG TPA: aldo/keto reductase [Streptosporangiaceae bacterium]|jgi:2,5-diketo-D-gluconate reductase A